MSATAELRAAAQKLRALAERAAHEDRTDWFMGHTKGSRSPVVLDHAEEPSVLIETYAARLEAVNRYVAAMGPRVGVLLAAWLESAAEDAEQIGVDPHALAVAKRLIGGDA